MGKTIILDNWRIWTFVIKVILLCTTNFAKHTGWLDNINRTTSEHNCIFIIQFVLFCVANSLKFNIVTLSRHCFRSWLGAEQAARHHLNQWGFRSYMLNQFLKGKSYTADHGWRIFYFWSINQVILCDCYVFIDSVNYQMLLYGDTGQFFGKSKYADYNTAINLCITEPGYW